VSEPALEHGTAAAPETYEAFYGFAHGPFSLAPDARCFYRGATHGRARDGLLTLIDGRQQCAVVVGPHGTGKTTLARALVSSFDRTVFAALILNPFLSRAQLLREVLFAYGVVSGEDVHTGRAAAASYDELAQALSHFVQALSSIGGHGVLVIDEAHNLPDESLSEVIRLSRGGTGPAPVQVVLLGEESLTAALLRSPEGLLGGREPERIAIGPLSRTELEAYVAYRLAEAKSSTAVYVGPEAVDELYRVTGGVPLLVNLVCDRALLISSRDRAHDVSVDVVQRAGRALNLAVPDVVPDRVPDAGAGVRRWKWMVPAVAVGMAVVLAAAFAVNIDLRLPPLPGVPHVAVAAPAEPIAVPPTLEFETLPALSPPASPPVPVFEPQAILPAPAAQSEPLPADGAP
jgi:general secretion pathway protein A